MQKDKNKHSFLKAGIFSLVVVGFISAILLLSQTGNVVVEQVVEREWKNANLGEISNGASSTIAEIYIVLTGQTYTTNLTNTSGYYLGGTGNPNANNTHVSSNINHSTAFDICVKVKWNKTHAFESSNNTWVLQYVNLTVDCPGLNIDDLAMTEYNITGQSPGDFMYVNYVADNGASGYQLSRGQSINTSGPGTQGMLFNATAYF